MASDTALKKASGFCMKGVHVILGKMFLETLVFVLIFPHA